MTRNNVCGWKGAQLGVLGALSMVVAARAQAAGDDDVTNDGVFTTIIICLVIAVVLVALGIYLLVRSWRESEKVEAQFYDPRLAMQFGGVAPDMESGHPHMMYPADGMVKPMEGPTPGQPPLVMPHGTPNPATAPLPFTKPAPGASGSVINHAEATPMMSMHKMAQPSGRFSHMQPIEDTTPKYPAPLGGPSGPLTYPAPLVEPAVTTSTPHAQSFRELSTSGRLTQSNSQRLLSAQNESGRIISPIHLTDSMHSLPKNDAGSGALQGEDQKASPPSTSAHTPQSSSPPQARNGGGDAATAAPAANPDPAAQAGHTAVVDGESSDDEDLLAGLDDDPDFQIHSMMAEAERAALQDESLVDSFMLEEHDA